MRGSRAPVMAIQAATGEMPSANPRKRCDQLVEAFGERVEKKVSRSPAAQVSARENSIAMPLTKNNRHGDNRE